MVSRFGPRLPSPAASLRFQSSTVVVEYDIAWISGNGDYCIGKAASALAGRDDLIQFNALHCGPPTVITRAGASGKHRVRHPESIGDTSGTTLGTLISVKLRYHE